MVALRFSKEEFVHLGLRMASNWSEQTIENSSYKTNKERLKDFYYASPRTLREIYRDIQHEDLGDCQIKEPSPREFLAAFYFLKKYTTKIAQAALVGVTEKYGLTKAWRYVTAIRALKEKKIRWIFDENEIECDEFFMLSVDGVHCRVQEPRTTPSAGWYSSKFNKAGLAYEIGVSVYHDKIVWVNGPFPAGQNDLRIFRKENGLMSKIPDGHRGIGDEGYVGEPGKAATRNEFDPPEVKDLKRRAKARQESVNSKLKAFGILKNVFRTTGKQRLEKHQLAFEACLVIVQYELDNKSRKLMKV